MLADKAVESGVSQFIYASSGSVYGFKEEPQVTEDLSLVPLSDYNKTKMISERVLLSYTDKILVQIVRPATVCGYSPRMRLDLSVNILTSQAFNNQKIPFLVVTKLAKYSHKRYDWCILILDRRGNSRYLQRWI